MRLAGFCIALCSSLFIVYSCTKDSDPNQLTRVQMTKKQILVHKPWMVQESYEMESTTISKYERGASNNTINFDSDLLTFSNDSAGVWKDIFGNTSTFRWSFTNPEQTKMRITVTRANGASFTLNYDMVQISDSSFSITFSQINQATGRPILASVRRVWKP